MGLLLSVLVACVGVIELITFYFNVKRNLTLRPVPGDLSSVREGYIQGLYDVRKRIIKDIQNLRIDTNELTNENDPTNDQRHVPALRLNSHEDIEIEYNKKLLARPSSSGSRRFLVTEKETESGTRERTPSPRRFVVSEEPQGLHKSRCKSSIPEFLIQEQNNPKKSPNHPRYVLEDHEGRSGSPIPLPSQFVVAERELDELVFQEASPKARNENSVERSASPYPPLNLPHAPKNTNELVDHPVVSVYEEDEDVRNIDDDLEESNFASKQYWKNKVLVVPSKKSKSRSPSPAYNKNRRSISPQVASKQLNKPKLDRSMSKSESEINNCNIPIATNLMTKAVSNSEISEREGWSSLASSYEVLEEENFQEDTSYDENYLNGLDGVSKQKSFMRNHSSRKTIRRRNIPTTNLERASSSKSEESAKSEITKNVLVSAVEELKQESFTNEIRDSSEVAGSSSSEATENKKPEPFWVKN